MQGDISEIFQNDLGENLIGGVKESILDQSWEKNKDVYTEVGWDSYDDYVNAGVALMNLDKLRERLGKKQKYWQRKNCRNQIAFLDSAYNCLAKSALPNDVEKAVILHYAGAKKHGGIRNCLRGKMGVGLSENRIAEMVSF